ncbi:hypothetical protein BDW59DRAFT_125268 [Aspergillus cavernicola]|uniref:Mid2 domain-containing protein n=1 Tax=Aspergillus cavernicola TaxID=176166 RepID=A0ABR4IVT5_9EURO
MHWNLVTFLPLALLPLVRGQGTVQDLWNLPVAPDYTTNFTAGTSVNISWSSGLVQNFAGYCEDCDVTDVDLWLTSSEYYRRLEPGVNVNTTFSYNWTINIDADDVATSTDWTLRFLPADVAWGENDQEISSSKFNIDPAPEEPSPTPSPSPSSSSTPTPTATTLPGDSGSGSDDSLSTGAKAGIGVGVSAGGLIIIALAFLLWRRLRSLPAKAPDDTAAAAGAYSDFHHPPPPADGIHQLPGAEGYFAAPMAKPPVSAPPSELPVDDTRVVNGGELDAGADGQRVPVELDASTPPETRR